ncbi:hypothetical protein P872_03300 [Rhodonellum psychrophilum GCM71 = DSM 17998]|uniref:Dolichol-P-glucose synthetase n=1 Tax=Rhodonellum psychrophilum GCM71 = DSM 17998 TaxID=1123057 RepID=U5C020_9BACT|nr:MULTISPECIES: lysylphosphatidylglycerol synthase transmembrane domain-containing protein [Rhodonellum]ERM83418.1 hypothetical protein P872_03300 [Rhodonellum psychrophilum GCM71 = DSM 17998]
MKLTLKQWIQVFLSFGVAIWIFWFLYKDISQEALLEGLRETSGFWLGLSILISIIGFWLRAWRWKLLIQVGESDSIPTKRVLLALMIGYLANLLVPRAGEIARCGALKKTEGIQIGKLFGTVILERTIDLIFLVSTISIAFLIEKDLFLSLLSDLVSLETLGDRISSALPLLLGGALVASIFIYLVFQKYRDHGLFQKFQHFIRDIIKGFISLKQVRNQFGFWSSSVLIWAIYYLTMYFVALAIPSTASLSAGSVLMVMVMGSIGMIAPVQGGIGTFHALVAFILMAYGLTNEEGKIFAVIVHGSQVLTVIVLGTIASAVFLKLSAKKEPKSS